MQYDRTIVAYHGCDRRVAERILKGERFSPSENDFDWLGHGIYFWEYGPHRALQFAKDQVQRKKVKTPAVVGALLQLGTCFDLMDTRFTMNLRNGYELLARNQVELPTNSGGQDHLLRRRDCAVINWYLDRLAKKA